MKPDDEFLSSVLVPSRLAPVAYRLACMGPLAFYVIAFLYPTEFTYRPPAPTAQLLWWALFLCSPAGAILGAVALLQIWRGIPRMTGSNSAAASVLIGVLGTIAVSYGSVGLNSVRTKYSHRLLSSCASHMKQIHSAAIQYVQDYDDQYPLSSTWSESLLPYVKNSDIFRCPNEATRDSPSYGMNRHLPGVFQGEIASPAKTVEFFESVPGKNVVGGVEMLPEPPRHSAYNICFVDGHVKAYSEKSIIDLRWKILLKKKKSGK